MARTTPAGRGKAAERFEALYQAKLAAEPYATH
jgi:hypothetical protein